MMCAIVEQQVIFLANETSRTKCFFLLMCLLLFLFIFLNVKFLNCIFTFYPTTSKSILFLPTHQNKYSLSLLLYVYIYFLFFTCTHSAILFFIHLSFFPLPSLQWKSLLKNYCSILPHAKKTIDYFIVVHASNNFFLLFRCVFFL